MKITLGTVVQTDFGDGPVMAMSEDWCIVLTQPKGPPGHREVAVQWCEVSLPIAPEAPASSITEKEIP